MRLVGVRFTSRAQPFSVEYLGCIFRFCFNVHTLLYYAKRAPACRSRDVELFIYYLKSYVQEVV